MIQILTGHLDYNNIIFRISCMQDADGLWAEYVSLGLLRVQHEDCDEYILEKTGETIEVESGTILSEKD